MSVNPTRLEISQSSFDLLPYVNTVHEIIRLR